MKLIIEMKCEKFPLMHQMLGASLIKQALMIESKEYCSQLYKLNDGRANKQTKNFCFAMRVFDYRLNQDEFAVTGKVVMVISSPDNELMIRLYNGFVKKKVFTYKTYELTVDKISLKNSKEIKRLPVILKTQSPIWIKDRTNQSLEITDPQYQVELNYICNEILKSYRGYGLANTVELEAVDMRKKVVKQTLQEFTNQTDKQIYYLNCYEGVFKFHAQLEDINDLVQLGIGFKRSQGYGLVETL